MISFNLSAPCLGAAISAKQLYQVNTSGYEQVSGSPKLTGDSNNGCINSTTLTYYDSIGPLGPPDPLGSSTSGNEACFSSSPTISINTAALRLAVTNAGYSLNAGDIDCIEFTITTSTGDPSSVTFAFPSMACDASTCKTTTDPIDVGGSGSTC